MATLTEKINEAIEAAGEMTGTPAQVQWAEDLANKRTDEIADILKSMVAGMKTGIFTMDDVKKALARGLKIIKINRAAWWIEHRGQTTSYLLLDEFDANLK